MNGEVQKQEVNEAGGTNDRYDDADTHTSVSVEFKSHLVEHGDADSAVLCETKDCRASIHLKQRIRFFVNFTFNSTDKQIQEIIRLP